MTDTLTKKHTANSTSVEKKARVVLLRPPMLVAKWANFSSVCPPLGLAYLAAAIRQAGYDDIRAVDALGEAPFQRVALENSNFTNFGLSTRQILDKAGEAPFDILCVSLMFSHDWPMSKALIQAVKRANPHIKIICGGEHVTACPEICLEDCPEIDVCVLGEGETTIIQLLRAFEDKQSLDSVKGIMFRSDDGPVQTPKQPRITNLKQIAWPAWDLFPLENYLSNGLGYGVNPGRTVPLLVSRGCPYQCTFCSNPLMWTTKWQARDIDELLAEMEYYIEEFGAENFDFYDLTTIVRKDWIIEFCNKVIKKNWKVSWQMPAGTRSEALDAESLRLMYLSGQRNLTYAPESGSPTTLKKIKKKINLDRMKDSIKTALDEGMNVKLNMIIGFPHETKKEVLETLKFIKDVAILGVHDVYIACFSPYPGTELFNQLKESGQIDEMDDEYFYMLTTYSDILYSESYSPHLSNRVVTFYRLAGMIMFYFLSYLTHPKRIFRLIRNLIRGKEESRLEVALFSLFDRFKRKKVVDDSAPLETPSKTETPAKTLSDV